MTYLGTAAVSLDSGEFASALAAADGFHDSTVDSIRPDKDQLTIQLGRPYFPVERRYSVGGVSGAILDLALLRSPVNLSGLMNAAGEHRIFEISLEAERHELIILFEYGFSASLVVAPQKSTFRWLK